MTMADKLTDIAKNMQKVYDAGYAAGAETGGGGTGSYDEGYADGKRDEYGAFWDVYQDCGNRQDYQTAFRGVGWTADTFRPTYDIATTGFVTSLFRGSRIAVDLVKHLNELGVTLDLSQSRGVVEAFMDSQFTRIGSVDVSSAASLQNLFNGAMAETIDELILKNDGTNTFSNTFSGCTALKNLTIKGVIGQNGFNVSACKELSRASIESIVAALSDEAGTEEVALEAFSSIVSGNGSDVTVTHEGDGVFKINGTDTVGDWFYIMEHFELGAGTYRMDATDSSKGLSMPFFVFTNDGISIEMLPLKEQGKESGSVTFTVPEGGGYMELLLETNSETFNNDIVTLKLIQYKEGASFSVTLSETAVESAFTDEEWTALKATKPNWNFVLA